MSKSIKRQFLDMRQKAKGNHPMRFLFTITPVSASDVPRDIEHVIFVWQRGAKIQETKVQTVDRSNGTALFDNGSVLRQTTTCYRSDNMWQPKPYKLKLQSVTKMKTGEDKTKTIGRYDIDFSVFCAMGLTGGEEEIEVNFKPRGVMRAVISAQWLKDFNMDEADDIMSEMPYGQSFTQSVASFGMRTDLDWEVLDFGPSESQSNAQNINQEQIDTRNFDQLDPNSSLKDEQWEKAKEALYEDDEQQNVKEPALNRRAVTLPVPPKPKNQPIPNLTLATSATSTPSAKSNPFEDPSSKSNPFEANPSKSINPFEASAEKKTQVANPFETSPSKNTEPTQKPQNGFVNGTKTAQNGESPAKYVESPKSKVVTKVTGPSPRVGQRIFSTPEPILEHPQEQETKPSAITNKLQRVPSSPANIASPSPTPQTPSKESNEKLSKFGWFKKQRSGRNLVSDMDEISDCDDVQILRQKAMLVLGQLEKQSAVGQKARFYIETLRNCLADVEQTDSGILDRMSYLQNQIEEGKEIDLFKLLASTKAQLADAHFQILFLSGELSKERARNRAILNKFTAQQTERDILLSKKSQPRLPFRVLRSFRSEPVSQ